MAGREEAESIRWRVHLSSPPETVHRFLATEAGRARFWAESASERDGAITFRFSDGSSWTSRILESTPPNRFVIEYVKKSRAEFDIRGDGRGGTDLTLIESGVPREEYDDNAAGWISVLLSLKAAVDFGVDLRSHDASRTWRDGYVDV